MSSRWTVHLHNRSCRAGRRQWSWPHREEIGGEKGSFLLASGSFGVTVDFDDSFGKGLRGFLRQIVPNAARDDPVRIFAREFLGIGTGVRVGCTIGISFERNGGHGDDRTFGKLVFQMVLLWPCRRITAGLSVGPASAYPTFKTPASICFIPFICSSCRMTPTAARPPATTSSILLEL